MGRLEYNTAAVMSAKLLALVSELCGPEGSSINVYKFKYLSLHQCVILRCMHDKCYGRHASMSQHCFCFWINEKQFSIYTSLRP